jgi:hypothetical protein
VLVELHDDAQLIVLHGQALVAACKATIPHHSQHCSHLSEHHVIVTALCHLDSHLPLIVTTAQHFRIIETGLMLSIMMGILKMLTFGCFI